MIVAPDAVESLVACLNGTRSRLYSLCEETQARNKAMTDAVEAILQQYQALCRRAAELCVKVRIVVTRLQQQCDDWSTEMNRIIADTRTVTYTDDDGVTHSYETYDMAAYAEAERQYLVYAERLSRAQEALVLAQAREAELLDTCTAISADQQVLAELNGQFETLARREDAALVSRGRQLCGVSERIGAYTGCRPFVSP